MSEQVGRLCVELRLGNMYLFKEKQGTMELLGLELGKVGLDLFRCMHRAGGSVN